MARYECSVCGYVYDESEESSSWDSLPGDWECPICAAAKSQFQIVRDDQPQAGATKIAAATAASPASHAILAHRVFGYVFLVIYFVLLVQMIPRLWTYQIEFPARTVVHLSLGMAIGTILVLKITIVRFFRRLDQGLIPILGTSILVGSVVLIGISVPSAFREAIATGRLFTQENGERVRTLLAHTGLAAEECARLASPDSLRAGQRVLRQECIACHDLRTVLAKPRTPKNWRQTVRRMADRTTLLNPLREEEQWQVTAYLVALSPQLQQSARQMTDAEDRQNQNQQAAKAVTAEQVQIAAYDETKARQLFEGKCSQCHPTTMVGAAPPSSKTEVRELVATMVEEGLEATQEELAQIVQYLTESYVKVSE